MNLTPKQQQISDYNYIYEIAKNDRHVSGEKVTKERAVTIANEHVLEFLNKCGGDLESAVERSRGAEERSVTLLNKVYHQPDFNEAENEAAMNVALAMKRILIGMKNSVSQGDSV